MKKAFTESRLSQRSCCLCSKPPVLIDALKYPWCEEHQDRGEFIDLGAGYSFPALTQPVEPGQQTYAVLGEEAAYATLAVLGSAECIESLTCYLMDQISSDQISEVA